MGVENQLERAERLVREIEEAERDVSRAEARLAAARQRAASVRSRQSSTDRRAAEKARNEAREADAAVGAAEAALEQARRKLGTSRAAREELGRGMVRYVSDQNRAVAQVRKAMAAAPYGREDLSRLRQQATGHARTGNRVLQILGMETIALDEGEDPRAPFPSAGAVASRAPGGLDESQSFATVAAASAAPASYVARRAGEPVLGTGLEDFAENFRYDLRRSLGKMAPPPDLLFSPAPLPMGYDEQQVAERVLRGYADQLGDTPYAPAVMDRLRQVADEELAPFSLGTHPRIMAIDRPNNPPEQSEHCNPHPAADVEASWVLCSHAYGPDSPEAQAAAWRYLETIETSDKELSARLDRARPIAEAARQSYYAFSDAHDVTALTSDEYLEFSRLKAASDEAGEIERELERALGRVRSRRAEVEQGLDPARRTTFTGRGGTHDFEHAYDGLITVPQGYVYDDTMGCCGVATTGGMANQQTGERNGYPRYLERFYSSHNVYYKPDLDKRSENGGTRAEGRVNVLRSYGLSAGTRTFGIGVRAQDQVSLEQLAQLSERGYSLGLSLRAEDLLGRDIAPRPLGMPSGANTKEWEANHSVAVAGFDFDAAGKVTCMWVNDTGGFLQGLGLRTNRIPITRKRFEKMRGSTLYMTVEWALQPGSDHPSQP